MMRKLIFPAIILFLFLMPFVLKACGIGDMDTVMGGIFAEQKVAEIGQLDCGKISAEQYQQTGEAYMNVMVPNKEQHELMDRMLGGEGSDSLNNFHAYLGRQYLGCSEGGVIMPMANMLTIMSTWNGPRQMMDFGAPGLLSYGGNAFWLYFWQIVWLLIPLAALAVLGLLIWFLVKKIKAA